MEEEILIVSCPRCHKIDELCICADVKPVTTQIHVLILQHPQEPDHEIGTAQMTHLALPNSTLKVGLSWANLAKALGKPAQSSQWAVLYLGSGLKEKSTAGPLQFISKRGLPLPTPEKLEGIVVLDGTWSQAKALWWRNAWLLKLNRAVLTPTHKSAYRELRKEPRSECLSTIETVAETLRALGEPVAVERELRQLFSTLLNKQRARKQKK